MARKKAGADETAMQNAAKTLYANIRFSDVDDPIKSIVVTSSVPNEGKSTVSSRLAEAIASSGKRTLIVECDMRKRSLYRVLGVRSRTGLYAVLTDEASLNDAVVATRQENLSFLDVEPQIPNPADVISSKRFARLLLALEEHYDYVVLDTPPLGAFVDAAILARIADATVFVIRENFTRKNEVLEAFEQLKKAEANVIGSVINYCSEASNSSSYYHYYSKAQESQPSARPAATSRPQQQQQSGTRFK